VSSLPSDSAAWFDQQVKPHEPTLRGYLHRIAATGDIDDVVQETYSRLFRARAAGKVRSAKGLLFATARNVTRDLFRRRAVANAHSIPLAETDVARVLDEAPSVAEIVSRRQETGLLAEAIDALPERCRAVLILRRFEHLSHREIAERLGISEHTVEAQLTIGFHRCADYLRKRGALRLP
jgi:RNA polymerase sigma factor (sigma-70 family)